MKAAIVTVGDELLSGDIVNTNASWLAAELTDRGVHVREIVTVPDERDVIGARVRRHADALDAVVVTGGLGGTPDDVTVEAVAAAFDRPLEVSERAREGVVRRVEWLREHRPELDLDVDVDAKARLPTGAEPLVNDEGLSPGCRLENVFVLPGIPGEMKAMFRDVAARFDGDRHARALRTSIPENKLYGVLEEVREEFGVSVGSYPNVGAEFKRLKVTGEDADRVEAAHDALRERLEAIDG